MSLELRPWQETQECYEAMAALYNTLYTNHAHTAEEIAASSRKATPGRFFACYFAYLDGQLAGFAECYRPEYQQRPGDFVIELVIHPDFQGRGIGSRLYETVTEEARGQNPARIEFNVREDMTQRRRFFARRGFSDEVRFGQWKLELARFDSSTRLQPEGQGIEIRTLAESGVLPLELINTLRSELRRDEPPVSFTPESFAHHVTSEIWFHPHAFWIALAGDEPVGVCWAAAYPDDHTLFLEFIGTKTKYRRQGVATALFARMLVFGQQHGYGLAEANLDLRDTEATTLLEKTGFERHPGWMVMVKTFKEKS